VIDLHGHTLASACGYLSAEHIVGIARAHGRTVMTVTDHDTTVGAVAVRDLVARTGDDILVLVGMEVSTSDAGHALVFGEGVDGDWGWRRGQPMPHHLPDWRAAMKAHPFRNAVTVASPRPIADTLPDLLPSIDAVERWNGNGLLVKAPHRQADLDDASLAYIARCGKVAVAASDAHRTMSIHAYHTVFANGVSSINHFVDQITAGSVWPGASPELDLATWRVAWHCRRVVGWYVDDKDRRLNASAVGYDADEIAATVANFDAIRRLDILSATAAEIVRDSGLNPVTPRDFLAIVRKESLEPARVR
jgi:hypothetical protein